MLNFTRIQEEYKKSPKFHGHRRATKPLAGPNKMLSNFNA